MTDHTPISKVSRLEVVSTGARRRWTLDEKQRIVAESYGGPRLVSVTARCNGLSASQLFTWRRLAREGWLSGDAVPALVPVEINSAPAPTRSVHRSRRKPSLTPPVTATVSDVARDEEVAPSRRISLILLQAAAVTLAAVGIGTVLILSL